MIKLKGPKSIIITIIIFMIFFSVLFSSDIIKFSYKNIINRITPSPTLAHDELPPYDYMNMGTAKKLEGNCVFINIFLSDEESYFTAEEKRDVMSKIKDMDTYFNERIRKYNKDLSIIYNLEDLSIDYKTDSVIPIDMGNWGYDIISDIYLLYDINSIIKKYDADNFSFIFNVNKIGRSYAKDKRYVYSSSYANEFIVMFTKYLDTAKETTSASYTHETLHLFGAMDLYYPYNPDDERLPLANKYFPDEIMIRRFNDINESNISNLTAYLIGWEDYLEEKYEVFLEEYKIK